MLKVTDLKLQRHVWFQSKRIGNLQLFILNVDTKAPILDDSTLYNQRLCVGTLLEGIKGSCGFINFVIRHALGVFSLKFAEKPYFMKSWYISFTHLLLVTGLKVETGCGPTIFEVLRITVV